VEQGHSLAAEATPLIPLTNSHFTIISSWHCLDNSTVLIHLNTNKQSLSCAHVGRTFGKSFCASANLNHPPQGHKVMLETVPVALWSHKKTLCTANNCSGSASTGNENELLSAAEKGIDTFATDSRNAAPAVVFK